MQYENIEGWFYPEDVKLYEEMVLLAKDNSIFIEIGCFKGRSTVAMCELIEKYNKQINFFAIDHFKGSYEHQNDPDIKDLFKIFLENICNYTLGIMPYESKKAVQFFQNNTIDFIYIDASHNYGSVKKDLNLWYPKLRESGIIAGHDYGWQSVKQAVDEFALENSLKVKTYGATSWKLI